MRNKSGKAAIFSGISGFVLVLGVYPLMMIFDRIHAEIPEPWQTMGVIYMPLAVILSVFAIISGTYGALSKKNKVDKTISILGLVAGITSMCLFLVIFKMIIFP